MEEPVKNASQSHSEFHIFLKPNSEDSFWKTCEEGCAVSYLQVKLPRSGTFGSAKSIVMVQGRAEATEVGLADATILLERVQKLRRELDWNIDRAYSGKYVVRGQSKA